jgi:hypothetical protein
VFDTLRHLLLVDGVINVEVVQIGVALVCLSIFVQFSCARHGSAVRAFSNQITKSSQSRSGAANGNRPVRNIKVYRQYPPQGHKRPIWPVPDWSACSCLRDRCGSACYSSCRQPLRPRLRWRPLDSSTPDCRNDGDLSTNKAKINKRKKERKQKTSH